jgi:O-acetyl-ADP-ribose deacetylase (regulator of RNase III)
MGCSGGKASTSRQDPVERILRRITVRPWNVLGVDAAGSQVGPKPDEQTAVLACSSMDELRSPGQPLGQLSRHLGAICEFVGIGGDTSFPNDVVAQINGEGEAGQKRYGFPSSKYVIHVADVSLAPQAGERKQNRRYGLLVRSMHRVQSTGTLLCLSTGSVTDFSGDAVVNAANEGCVQGAGVDDAIGVAGGKALRDARMALPVVKGATRRDGAPTEVRCPMGEVRVTIGGGLKASWCIHAVGPNYDVEIKAGVSMAECDQLVETIYRRVIEAAKEKALSSIAFCLISGGRFRGQQDLVKILQLGLTGIRDTCYAGLKEVHVVAFTPEEQDALQAACKLVLPNSDEAPTAEEDAKMSQSAAIDKLSTAYSNVFSVASQLDKPKLRLSPISDGNAAAAFRKDLPEMTMQALAQALRQLPSIVLEKLPACMDICVQDPTETPKYERSLGNARNRV